MKDIYSIEVETADGIKTTLGKYKSSPLLISNIACNCGLAVKNFTNFKMLQEKFPTLKILLFPSNQFKQELGDISEIKRIVKGYSEDFILFGKVKLLFSEKHEIFEHLTSEKGSFLLGNFIKWNFTKFLVDKDGKVVKRVSPSILVKESDIAEII